MFAPASVFVFNDAPPLRYSLRQLRYFVVTAQVLSFTAASKLLHISQPSISTALAELESTLGVQLFIRHHASGLSLTQAGRDMLGLARNLLKNADELQSAARELDGGMSGEIALGCLVSLAPRVLPPLVSRFMGQHAGISFHTHETHQDELFQGLRDGVLDLVLTYDLDLEEDIAFTPLMALPPYVILPKQHKLAGAGAVSLASLLDEPYVMLDLPHSREYFASLFNAFDHRPEPTFRSAQPEVVRGMVACGLGYSILNFPLKSTHTVDGGEFAICAIKDEVRPTTLGIAQMRHMRLRQVVHRFAQFCEETMQELH